MYVYTNAKAGDPGIGSLDGIAVSIYLYWHGMERRDESEYIMRRIACWRGGEYQLQRER